MTFTEAVRALLLTLAYELRVDVAVGWIADRLPNPATPEPPKETNR